MSTFLFRRRSRAPRFLIVLSLLASPALAVRAGEAPLGLQDAVNLAAQNAPMIQARAERLTAAHEDAVRAGRLPDPELDLGLNNLTATGPSAFDPAADMMTMQSIGIMQKLPSHAAREAQRAMANADVDSAEAMHLATRLDVRAAAAQAWVALWVAQRKRELLEDLRKQAKTAVLASKAQLAGGRGDASDALATRADLADLDNRITAAQADIDAARAELARWIGADADRALAQPPDFAELPVAPETLLAQLDRQAPLLQWSARESQADAALDAARAGKHPDWSVGLSYGKRFAGRTDMISLDVGVSLPIFPGNRQDRDISARYAERDAVHFEHEDARRVQRAAIEKALADWRGWTQQVQRYRSELLPLASDRSRVALAAYRGGASLQPWLEARRDEIKTNLDYADALAQQGRDWAALAYLIPESDSSPEMPR
jgi:outer membrane protein TolC